MRIAKEFDGEIISADSWQVYKGFDIGTSKSSKAEQKQVKHHLIDVVEASEGFNAPKFKELADKAIADIQNRGKLPIMVGGTGLYIDSVLFDYGFLPNLGPAERAKLDAMSLAELIELAESLGIDLSDIDTRNKRRVVRAIEAGGQKPTKSEMKPGILIVGLKPAAQQLQKNIQARTKQMIAAGLEREVRTLSKKYGWDSEPMKGIGYLQWRGYLASRQSLSANAQSLSETEVKIIKATRGLAKRQWTWLKRNPYIKWFESPQEAYAFLTKQL
jgi:tRNA dimethylallyltransferase